MLEFRVLVKCDLLWWNGLQVLAWQLGTDNGHTAESLWTHREPALLKSLTALQQERLRREAHEEMTNDQ